MNKNTSQITLDGLVNGDEKVVKEIYSQLFPEFVLYIKKNSGTEEDAYEVFQETLYQIIVRSKTRGLMIEDNFEGYLFICGRNIWLKKLNKSKKNVRNQSLMELISEEDQTAEQIVFQDRWDLFEEKISQLSENCKSLLQSYFKRVPYETIIKEYGYASKNVAFQRIHKCKKKLTQLIQIDPRYKEL